jgi:hypothetical protein
VKYPCKIGKEHLPDLQSYVTEYPYSQTLRLLYLKGLYNIQDIKYENELRIASVYVYDRHNLHRLITSKPLAEVKPEKQEAILPEKQLRSEVVAASLERVSEELFSPVQAIDIQSIIEKKGTKDESQPVNNFQKRLKRQELIDDFIQASETSDISISIKEQPSLLQEEQITVADTSKTENEEFFTETLAKIYIKQHKFEKAIRIFKRLSLKYPEKSIYFADQIRFFEKLIKNL